MTLEKKYPPEIITADRVVLKKTSPEYADKFYAMVDHDRANLGQFLYWVDKTDSVSTVREYAVTRGESWKNYESFVYRIFLKDSDEVIGSIDMQKIDWDNYSSEIGYFISSAYQGRGMMVEAVNALVKEAFAIGFRRMVIKTRPDNKRSQTVALRCGFTHEGTLRKAVYAREQFYDDMIFSRLCCDD